MSKDTSLDSEEFGPRGPMDSITLKLEFIPIDDSPECPSDEEQEHVRKDVNKEIKKWIKSFKKKGMVLIAFGPICDE